MTIFVKQCRYVYLEVKFFITYLIINLSLGIRSKALLASRRRRKRAFLAEKREKLIHSVRSRTVSSWLDPAP